MKNNKINKIEFSQFLFHWRIEPISILSLADYLGCTPTEVEELRRRFGLPRREIDRLPDASPGGLLDDILFTFDQNLTDTEYATLLDYVTTFNFRGYDRIQLTLWLYYAFFYLSCKPEIELCEYLIYIEDICIKAGLSFSTNQNNNMRKKALDTMSQDGHFIRRGSPQRSRLRLFRNFYKAHLNILPPSTYQQGLSFLEKKIMAGNPKGIVAGLVWVLGAGRITQAVLAQWFKCSEVTVRINAKKVKDLFS